MVTFCLYIDCHIVVNCSCDLFAVCVIQLNAPLHLSATVLNGSDVATSNDRALDTARFMRLCTTHAADCTLALGWAAGRRCRRYTWSDVTAMYDILDRCVTAADQFLLYVVCLHH